MQFFIALLGMVGLASASLRLPLPVAVIQEHPELMHEPLFPDNRIVYGKPVAQGEVKYQIGLIRSGSFICGGSIVNSKTVITAAHCVYGYETRPTVFKARAGTLDRQDASGDRGVAAVFRHPKYNQNTIDYDIAVLQLSDAIQPSDSAGFVAMDTEVPTGTDDLILTGWGRNENQALPGMLQKAESLKAITKDDCQKRWSAAGNINISDRMQCVVSTEQSACNGDSGGPLVSKRTGKQVGVVSWGASGCRVNSYPNVFVAVANQEIADYIKQNTIA